VALCRSESLEETGEESGQESPEVGEEFADVVSAAAQDGEESGPPLRGGEEAGPVFLEPGPVDQCRQPDQFVARVDHVDQAWTRRVGVSGQAGAYLMAARIAGFAAEANQTLQFQNAQLGRLLNRINALGVAQGRLLRSSRNQWLRPCSGLQELPRFGASQLRSYPRWPANRWRPYYMLSNRMQSMFDCTGHRTYSTASHHQHATQRGLDAPVTKEAQPHYRIYRYWATSNVQKSALDNARTM